MSKLEIEAVLERSLRKQIAAPRLGKSFDADVWARIDAEQSRDAARTTETAVPAARDAVRWLNVINILGLVSVGIFLCTFGVQSLADLDLAALIPRYSLTMSDGMVVNMCAAIATVAMAFGFMFTPWGRRLRDEFN